MFHYISLLETIFFSSFFDKSLFETNIKLEVWNPSILGFRYSGLHQRPIWTLAYSQNHQSLTQVDLRTKHQFHPTRSLHSEEVLEYVRDMSLQELKPLSQFIISGNSVHMNTLHKQFFQQRSHATTNSRSTNQTCAEEIMLAL